MSTTVVNYKTIDNILSFRVKLPKTGFSPLKDIYDSMLSDDDFLMLTELGKKFLKLNYESFCKRYDEKIGEAEQAIIDGYRFKFSNPSIFQAIKSLDCLLYNSDNIENFENNETYQNMTRLREGLMTYYFATSEEYKKAKWLDDELYEEAV